MSLAICHSHLKCCWPLLDGGACSKWTPNACAKSSHHVMRTLQSRRNVGGTQCLLVWMKLSR